jgi:hypothetical protein
MADCLSVDNMAQLRAIPTLEGMVNVKGFSSIGDGGGGNFIWDPDSEADDNNGTIIVPKGQSIGTKGRWIRQFFEEINVRWFGAKGDVKGIAGEYKGTVSVTASDVTFTADTPVFVPEDTKKQIVMWDSKGILNTLEKPFEITRHVNPSTVKLNRAPISRMDNVCFAWGTDDTHAIQDAWKATNGVYRLIFPTGTYYVTTLYSSGIDSDGTKWDLPSAYLEGIGKVIIVSPNSLGDPSRVKQITQIIKFTKSCGPASITNMIFQGISTSDAGIVQYSDGTSATLPSPFNAAGEAGPFNQRVGIYYQGKDAIICKNVEVSNMPCAGLLIDNGVGQSLIENSYFHANGLFNIKVFAGERLTLKDETLPDNPVIRGPVTRVTRGGSIKLSHTRIEDSIPVAYGGLSYGIEMGGCDFTAIDCDFVNNTGAGVGNDDANPSTMTFDNCRFAFGKNNGKLSFPRTLTTVHVDTMTDPHIVDIVPFPSPGSVQGAPGISMRDVFWSLDGPVPPGYPANVLTYGTAGTAFLPKITITGIANQPVILKIICTSPGVRGQWTLQYSTDNGKTFYPSETTSETSKTRLPIYSSETKAPTGLTLNIDADILLDPDTHKATVGDLWLADNTYSYCLPWKKGDTKIKTVRAAQHSSSKIETASLTWILISTSSLLTVDGPCQNFSCTNCLFKGTDATTHQISAVLIKGHTYDPRAYDPKYHRRSIESHRVVKIIGNTFDSFDVDAIIYLRPWTTKEIKIQNNVFVDSPFSQCIVHDPQQFDIDPIKGTPLQYDKKAISKIIHLSGNTYVDAGRVYLNSGGLIEINDERVIYTGKSYFPTIPYTPPIPPIPSSPPIAIAQYFPIGYHFYIPFPPDPVNAYPGRVGRVIRRNNTISGHFKLYYPPTTASTPRDPFPTWWSWHEGDTEEIEFPGARDYSSYGFNGSTSTVPDHETELTVAWLPPGGSITDQFQAGAEISMPGATWGGGFPHVVLAAVDRTKGVGQVCARTALPADKEVHNVGILGPTPSYYGGRICTASGTFGGCTAHATTSVGNYSITITDDVLTLCPQQIISIAGVTFTSPNVGGAKFTEIVDVIGNEGHPGSIIVRDAPDQAVTGAAVSFVPPKLVLYHKIASTGVAGGAP